MTNDKGEGEMESKMKKWFVGYRHKNGNYNRQNATVEANTPEDAKALLKHDLADVNGVEKYDIEEPVPYIEPPPGRVISRS